METGRKVLFHAFPVKNCVVGVPATLLPRYSAPTSTRSSSRPKPSELATDDNNLPILIALVLLRLEAPFCAPSSILHYSFTPAFQSPDMPPPPPDDMQRYGN